MPTHLRRRSGTVVQMRPSMSSLIVCSGRAGVEQGRQQARSAGLAQTGDGQQQTHRQVAAVELCLAQVCDKVCMAGLL